MLSPCPSSRAVLAGCWGPAEDTQLLLLETPARSHRQTHGKGDPGGQHRELELQRGLEAKPDTEGHGAARASACAAAIAAQPAPDNILPAFKHSPRSLN